MKLEPLRIKQAKKLIIPFKTGYIVQTSFEELGTIITDRAASLKFMRNDVKNQSHAQEQVLSDFFRYTSKRLTDILIRLQEINWKRTTLFYDIKPDTYKHPIDPQTSTYNNFLSLSIKDFHVDIISFMDSLAPIVILAESNLKSKDRKKPPGWSDIKKDSNRNFRANLSSEALSIIDRCEEWLSLVKEIRNLLTHRNHGKIVFGGPKEVLLFQFYDKDMKPAIVLPEVLHSSGNNVADFELYSAAVLSEIFVLLDVLGNFMAQKMGFNSKRISQIHIREIHKAIVISIERLDAMLSE